MKTNLIQTLPLYAALVLFSQGFALADENDHGTREPGTEPEHSIVKPYQSLEQRVPCCDSFSQLVFKELPPNFRATLHLNEQDQVLDLDSGRTYVEALVLPLTDATVLLEIQSVVSQPNILEPSTVLFPVVTFLDQDYNSIITMDDLPFTYYGSFGNARRINMVITLDRSLSDARYVLIHSIDRSLDQMLSTFEPVQVIERSGFETMAHAEPTTTRKRIHFTHEGLINVLAYVEAD